MSGHVPAKLLPLSCCLRRFSVKRWPKDHPARKRERRLLVIAHPEEMPGFVMIAKITY
jgi:hypothetical protein